MTKRVVYAKEVDSKEGKKVRQTIGLFSKNGHFIPVKLSDTIIYVPKKKILKL